MGTSIINNPKAVAGLLQECQQILDQLSPEVEEQTGGAKTEHQQYGALLPDDLRTLIEEAKEMKWPFVPERWQYKEAVHLEDKTNLQDMISAKLCDLLVYLKASITTRDYDTAAAIAFLIDRFLYWVDGSTQLLQIVKKLHRLQPTMPIAPQLMIRQARVSVNSGKLLKAEYILSSLINDSGATGVWKYSKESDRILVQSVCIQIRGQILQKLGMWYEAAELTWASILGYFTLPQPDKKGIGTSLGILADIFVSMSENDYDLFKNNYQFDLDLLKEFDHRLLSAAEACKLAAAFCPFTSLFVLTAMNIRGTCLLSYSCSSACPSEKEMFYLSEAKKSFEIGLLTKNNKELVTSKQELHSFVKAAFCLSKVHQWLYGENGRLTQISLLCQEALEKLYAYSHSTDSEEQDKGQLAKDIMGLVMSAKEQLHVQSFPNSDALSYIPDDYKTDVNKPMVNGDLSFEKVLKMHAQHHEAVCDIFESACRSHKAESGGRRRGACITTLKTETRNVDTMCTTEERSHCGSGAAKNPGSQKLLENDEVHNGQMQQKLSHDAVLDVTLGEETESEHSERCQNSADDVLSGSQSGSEVSSSLRSWSQVSRSNFFTSWEDTEDELPQDKVENPKGKPDKEQTVSLSGDISKNNQESNFCWLSSKMHPASLQETQHDCTSHLKHPFQNNVALTNLVMEPNAMHLEKALGVARQSHKEASSTTSGNSHDNLNSTRSLPSEQGALGITFSSAVDCRTKGITDNGESTSKYAQCINKNESPADPECCKETVGSIFRSHCPLEGPERETVVDASRSAQMKLHHLDDRATAASVDSNLSKLQCDNYVQDWISKSITRVPEECSFEIPEVDPQAETAEDWEFGGQSEDHLSKMFLIRDQQSPSTSSPSRTDNRLSVDCTTTEEDEGEKIRNILHSRQSSSSSLKSWYRAPNFSSSFSELGTPSFSNSSSSSFVFIEKTKEQNQKARILSNDDYDQLLSGVQHDWLMQRMKNMGLFKPNLLHQSHSALLLKFSKKSGLWTAQETAVYAGDYLSVAKKGKQRNAFWIHFLHQEETLGRYVGKEYKDKKELLHHFNDVERQMTAQFYVTEFNKRLYELKIPTQIFYIPSVVLLILEGKLIQGCISVEPYILGEFVKLSNNTKVVKLEYKATEYGLAYGHFCYGFSQGSDVVVDLQGWVTGNGKGIIYLTDPQIHSLDQNKASCLTNFGKKGIYYFFNNQHAECNEICHRLSLSRPLMEKPN